MEIYTLSKEIQTETNEPRRAGGLTWHNHKEQMMDQVIKNDVPVWEEAQFFSYLHAKSDVTNIFRYVNMS